MTRNYVPGHEPVAEVLVKPEVQRLPKIAVSKQFERIRHWAPLAQLKLRWNSLQQRVAEQNWQGHYDDAKRELYSALQATTEKLRTMRSKLSLDRSEQRKAKEIDSVVGELEMCLKELDGAPADATLIYRTEQYVRERILSKYDEISSRCVRMRRRADMFRHNVLENLKRGRLVRCGLDLMRKPWMCFVDSYLCFRFFVAIYRKEI